MDQVIRHQLSLGGHVCVVSHSVAENIRRDYRENGLPEPELVFGWERPPEQRKPAVYPLQEIMRTFGMKPEELLVIDDLKPGYDMAKAAGVPFAAAGWANDIPEIESFMRKNCGLWFMTSIRQSLLRWTHRSFSTARKL
jgi:phosphoglycolate phosphatase/pyrophosphatase PpaX